MGRCEQPILPDGRCPIDVGGAVLVEVTRSTEKLETIVGGILVVVTPVRCSVVLIRLA